MQILDPATPDLPPAAPAAALQVRAPSPATSTVDAQAQIASLATGAAWLRLIGLIQARPLGDPLTAECWQRWTTAAVVLDDLLRGELEPAHAVAVHAAELLGSNPLLREYPPAELLLRLAEEQC